MEDFRRLAAGRARWDPVQRVPFVRIYGEGGRVFFFFQQIFRKPGAISHL